MRGEMVGARAMSASERQKRSRSLRYLREKEAEAAALLDYVRSGLLGTDPEALSEIAELIAGLPDRLERIEDELRKAGGAPPPR